MQGAFKAYAKHACSLAIILFKYANDERQIHSRCVITLTHASGLGSQQIKFLMTDPSGPAFPACYTPRRGRV